MKWNLKKAGNIFLQIMILKNFMFSGFPIELLLSKWMEKWLGYCKWEGIWNHFSFLLHSTFVSSVICLYYREWFFGGCPPQNGWSSDPTLRPTGSCERFVLAPHHPHHGGLLHDHQRSQTTGAPPSWHPSTGNQTGWFILINTLVTNEKWNWSPWLIIASCPTLLSYHPGY